MRISYKILLELNNRAIEDGLFGIFNNAVELDLSSAILAENKKYAQAVTMKILAIEELIKGMALFLFRVGVRNEEVINFGFKKLKEHTNIHQTRLKAASVFSYLNNIGEDEIINQKMEEAFSKMSRIMPIKGETIEKFADRILKSLPDIKSESNAKQVLISREAELTKVENDKTWLTEAQTLKEKAMYVDILDHKWQFPSEITENDYNESAKYFNQLRQGHFIKIIEELKDQKPLAKKLTFLLLTGLIKKFPPDYHNW